MELHLKHHFLAKEENWECVWRVYLRKKAEQPSQTARAVYVTVKEINRFYTSLFS